MVHVAVSSDMHRELCKLKSKARNYWLGYWGKHPDIKKMYKGKVSIDEVIRYLVFTRS